MTDRKTELLVTYEAEVCIKGTAELRMIKVEDVPCTWLWDESTRAYAEYWAAADHLARNRLGYQWFTILNWSASPPKKAS